MQTDPVAEWQRLTEFYRDKTDEALEELAEDFGNLTDTAQQVLTTELRSRGLSLPGSKPNSSTAPQSFRESTFRSDVDPDEFLPNEDADAAGGEAAPHEYTWKTLLCECNDGREAWQLAQALKRAGIECWVEPPRGGIVYPRVLVPADQLEEARAIAAQPIPQDIVEESKDLENEPEEYEPPTCPKCHAEDPVLESADPSNNWLCEACDARWSDPIPDSDPPPAR
jgi:hypothetical protein